MSRFYANIFGDNRKELTRRGQGKIEGHIRGWKFGIKVVGRIDDNGREIFTVYTTGGSDSPNIKDCIVEFIDGT